MSDFNSHTKKQILSHIIEFYPLEIVGCLYDGEYHRFKNISTSPTLRYEISEEDQLEIYRNNATIVHSHDALIAIPSNEDIRIAEVSKLDSIIVATDGEAITAWHKIERAGDA